MRLTYSGGANRPGKLCYNFTISNDLTQMVNFLTKICDCDPYRPALLDLFTSSEPSIYSSAAFHPFGSDHVSVSTGFLQIEKFIPLSVAQLVTILVMICTVFVIIWEMFHGRISLNLVLLLLLSCVWVQAGIHVFLSIIVNVWSSLVHLLLLISNSVLNKSKSAISPLFNVPEKLSSASEKAKLFAENSGFTQV